MQRPRRTTEFCENPSASKRLSRQQLRTTVTAPSPAPSTANKYATRQSRIPTRPSSLDRASAGEVPCSSKSLGATGLQPSGSAMRCRNTPQRTPLNKYPATRLQFTAEKQRSTGAGNAPASGGGGGGGSVSHHNDKKWVLERTQRITDYLRMACENGTPVPGLNKDFFTRPGALRQMSIKQFVAIINYFLPFIAGNRFTVGTNHVEDIVNILQKIQYPYQVNKSWLKTPNTQHSFGNVIVLLDFLMDFAPAITEEQARSMQFPLQDFEDMTSTTFSGDAHLLVPPDAEFQKLLLRQSEEGFMLWDKQFMDEFSALQQQTCDELILKRCKVAGRAALDIELKQLQDKLVELEKHRPSLRVEDEEYLRNLQDEYKYTKQQIEMLRDDMENEAMQYKHLETKRQILCDDIARMESEVAQARSTVQNQICSIEQREKLIEEAAQLKHMLHIQEESLRDLQDRNHQQQVQLSRIKKQFTDQVQIFNTYMRDISYTLMYPEPDELQLPLNPDDKDLQRIQPIIRQLHKHAQNKVEHDKKQVQKYEQEINEMTHEIDAVLEPKANALQEAIDAAQERLQAFEQHMKTERKTIDDKLKALNDRAHQSETEITELKQMIALKQEEVKAREADNEEIMSKAEKEYTACADAREAFLQKYAAAMTETSANMEDLMAIVQENQSQLEKIKQQDSSKEREDKGN